MASVRGDDATTPQSRPPSESNGDAGVRGLRGGGGRRGLDAGVTGAVLARGAGALALAMGASVGVAASATISSARADASIDSTGAGAGAPDPAGAACGAPTGGSTVSWATGLLERAVVNQRPAPTAAAARPMRVAASRVRGLAPAAGGPERRPSASDTLESWEALSPE